MKIVKYTWWIVVNGFNQPLYKQEPNGMMWVFLTRKDATAFIKSRKIDRKLKKLRKVCKIIITSRDMKIQL